MSVLLFTLERGSLRTARAIVQEIAKPCCGELWFFSAAALNFNFFAYRRQRMTVFGKSVNTICAVEFPIDNPAQRMERMSLQGAENLRASAGHVSASILAKALL